MGGDDEIIPNAPLPITSSLIRYSPQPLNSIFIWDGWCTGWEVWEKPAKLTILPPSEIKPFCCYSALHCTARVMKYGAFNCTWHTLNNEKWLCC